MARNSDTAGPGEPPPLAAAEFTRLAETPVRFAGRELELVLESVEEHASVPGAGRRPFTLVFRGPPGGGDLLPEGLHRCLFADGTARDIHVAPIHTPDPGRQDYAAVFN